MELMPSGELPRLERVTSSNRPARVKLRLVVDNMSGLVPFTASGTSCGEPGKLALMEMDALHAPVAEGVAVIWIAQVEPAASEELQVLLLMAKSDALAPAMVIPFNVALAPPVFFTVTV